MISVNDVPLSDDVVRWSKDSEPGVLKFECYKTEAKVSLEQLLISNLIYEVKV